MTTKPIRSKTDGYVGQKAHEDSMTNNNNIPRCLLQVYLDLSQFNGQRGVYLIMFLTLLLSLSYVNIIRMSKLS